MKIILTTQLTYNYYEKTKPLFDCIKHNWHDWHGLFYPIFIGFKSGYVGYPFYADIKNVKTYRKDYPLNRKNYVCLQAGEFLDFIPNRLIDDDDVIIQIDSDVIMQRPFTKEELSNIIPEENQIISVLSSNPPPTLEKVSDYACFHKKLGPLAMKNIWGNDWQDKTEFTGSILIARKSTFKKLRDYYVSGFDDLTKTFDHHAAGQWFINYLGYKHFDVRIIDSIYQCADWYQTFNTSEKNGKLTINDKTVIFNHTKYNKIFNYK